MVVVAAVVRILRIFDALLNQAEVVLFVSAITPRELFAPHPHNDRWLEIADVSIFRVE